MLFTTAQFALFLGTLLVLLRVLPRRLANPLLLGASLLFYTLWIPAYLPLLLVDIGVNYALLRAMRAASPGSGRRRLCFAASVLFTIGLLLYFKYALFLVESALPLLRALALDVPLPDVLLPLGISFYSFQIVSLAADAYAASPGPDGGLPVGGLARYALYIAFFPQLVAGPILRGRELLPQLERGPEPGAVRTRRGVWLLASGVAKKLLLADFLLAPFVETVFAAPGVGNAGYHWVALYAFSFQVYFDFSGYTDMARGMAFLIGYELPENFHEPFLARSPQEFWARWHITLSRWLSLYLFTPLARALMRRGAPRWDASAGRVAQLATMAICGLWHGAGWTFVWWGVLQGVLLVLWRLPRPAHDEPVRWRHLPSILLFYHLFCLTLVLFRSTDLAAAGLYLEGLFSGGPRGWPIFEIAVVLGCALLHVAERALRPRAALLQGWFAGRWSGPCLEAAALGALLAAATLAAGAGAEFIYFQF